MVAITTFAKITEDSARSDKSESCPADPKLCRTLREAVRNGSLEAVKYLIEEKKMNVDGRKLRRGMNTPLCEAAFLGHSQIVDYLVEKKADVNRRCLLLMPPLTLAIRGKKFEVVKYLVENGAKISQTDVSENSPLHHAASANFIEIAEFLLAQEGVQVNLANSDGNTPLHLAASYSSIEMVKLLVENNADIKVINKNGETALDLAKFYNNKDVLDYLGAKSGGYRRSIVPISMKFSKNINSLPHDKPLITVKRLGLNRDKSANEEIEASHTMSSNIINTLFLLDLIIRYFTKQKYTNTSEVSISKSESQENALKIMDKFEDLLKFYSSVSAEQVDWDEVHSNIYKTIKNAKGDKIHGILCSHLKPLSNLNSEETQELLSAVLASNPMAKLPKAETSDASTDLSSMLFNSCMHSA